MNENQNVTYEENSEEIGQIISNLVNDVVNNTPVPSNTPSNSPSNSATPPPTNLYAVGHTNLILEELARRERTFLPLVQTPHNEVKPTFEIYRAMRQFTDSQSDIDVEVRPSTIPETSKPANRNLPPAPPSVPPSYSTVIKQGRPSLDIRRDARSMEAQHLSPFTRIPPPSYAEIHGVWSRDFSNASSEQILLGPDPIYIWCMHCGTVVVTVTQSQRSKFTHITAAALCLFGCWPCAMLPYCMNSCKNIYHYCPDCNYLFGMYRPW